MSATEGGSTAEVGEKRRRKATLTADGYEPFEQTVTGGGDDVSVAQFCAEVWLLGHPERRAAKNIQVTVEDES